MCDRERLAGSQDLTSSTPPTALFTRVRISPGCCKPAYGGAHETGPAPHEGREVVAVQISASRGDQAGAPFAAHQGEEFPTARASIGALGDIGYVAKGARQGHRALTKRRPSARKSQSMRLCPIERIAGECIVVSVRSLCDFQAAYEVGASQKRLCPVGAYKPAMPSRNLQGVILSQRSRRLR